MKTTLGQLRKLINEELVRGVPVFVFRQTTEDFVNQVKKHLVAYVNVNKSNNDLQKKEAMEAVQDACEKLGKDTMNVVEDALWMFIQDV